MHKSKMQKILIAACFILPYSLGFAASLGKINVYSALGDPLAADIEVSATKNEKLVATIISEKAYAPQEVLGGDGTQVQVAQRKSSTGNAIKVSIGKNSDGSSVLKLNSSQPVHDQYIELLVQLDSSSGRSKREYTVLLNTPKSVQAVEVTPLKSDVERAPPNAAYKQKLSRKLSTD